MNSFERAKEIFEENGLEYSKELHEKLEIYYNFLVEYNEKVNLTAITEKEDVWIKHFADSIVLLKYAEIPKGASMIDVGTGAGFPSVPVKIFRPDIKLTLLDSLNKRIVFLNQLCERLDIKCDFAVARAVASMPVLCEYCTPFLKEGGIFAAMKGPNEDIESSLEAIKKLGCAKDNVYEYLLSGCDKRKIFTVKKISHTSSKYPRNSSQIKNKPL